MSRKMSRKMAAHRAKIARIEAKADKLEAEILALENSPPCCPSCGADEPLLFVGERSDGRQIRLCAGCAP